MPEGPENDNAGRIAMTKLRLAARGRQTLRFTRGVGGAGDRRAAVRGVPDLKGLFFDKRGSRGDLCHAECSFREARPRVGSAAHLPLPARRANDRKEKPLSAGQTGALSPLARRPVFVFVMPPGHAVALPV